MAVLPFRWQGTTRTEQVRSLLAMRVQEWLGHWAASSEGLECTVISAGNEPSGVDRHGDNWHVARDTVGTLSIGVGASTFGQLGSLLAGVAKTDTCGLAAGIGRRAFMDLARTLISGREDSVFELDVLPQAEAVDPRCGVMGFLLSLGRVEMMFFLDAALCDALLPRAVQPAERLASRRDAILPGEITLNAVLDLGHAALKDTVTLQPGEIIKTSIKLDSVVDVRTESGQTVFSGVLAAASGHRALRYTGTSHRLKGTGE